MNISKTVLLNVGLRFLIMLSRFGFIFIAAMFLPLDELGTYGIIVATIAYSLYFLGLDFYTFANREVIGADRSRQVEVIVNQFKLYLITFILFFMPLMSVFWLGLVEWKWVFIFYLLLVAEHLAIEFQRLTIAMEKPILATWMLFIRSASWIYVVVVAFLMDEQLRNLELVLYLWFLAAAISVFLGARSLKLESWSEVFKLPLPVSWWLKGLKVSSVFLVGTLAIRAVFTLDRYQIEWTDGLSMVGIYTVYLGICSAMATFIDAAVFQFLYPSLVKQVKSGDGGAFTRIFKEIVVKVLFCVLFCVTGLYFLVEFILGLLIKPEFLEYLSVFWWLLFAQSLWVLSLIPHFGLYALGRDFNILYGHLAALVVFLVALLIMPGASGMSNVAMALSLSFLTTLLVKGFFLVKPYQLFMKEKKV